MARRPVRPGEKTVLGRNPYWYEVDQEKKRLPYLDEVVFLSVPDQDAADLKFRAGELHGLERVKPENYQWYADNQQKGNFTLYDIGPDLNTNILWFNLNTVKKAAPGKKVGDPDSRTREVRMVQARGVPARHLDGDRSAGDDPERVLRRGT